MSAKENRLFPFVEVFLALCSVLVLVVAAVFFAFYRLDLFRGDVDLGPLAQSLVLERDSIPDEENAFFYFVTAAEKIDISEEEYYRISELITENHFRGEEAKRYLRTYAESLEYLKKGLDCQACQDTTVWRAGEFGTFLLSERGKITNLILVHLTDLADRGDFQGVLEWSENFFDLAGTLQNCKSSMIMYVMGAAMKRLALDFVWELLASNEVPQEFLAEMLDRLDEYYPDGNGLADAFRLECNLQWLNVDLVTGGLNTNAASGASLSPLLKPNRTRNTIAEIYTRAIEGIPECFNEIKSVSPNQKRGEQKTSRIGQVLKFLSGNTAGEILLKLIPDPVDYYRALCYDRTYLSATKVVIALSLYDARMGALPSSLGDLVPEFLPRVPIDYFDCQPIRYSREERRIYSISSMTQISSDSSVEKVWKSSWEIPF